MTILYLTTEGFDTAGPNNQMASMLIDKFLNTGHFVKLVQSVRKRVNEPIPLQFADHPNFSCENISRKVIDKSKFLVRYLDEALYAFKSAAKWLKFRKSTEVVLLQSCPTVIFSVFLLKLFLRKPIVYNVYDVWPGHAASIGVMNRFLHVFFRFVQKPVYRLVDRIVVLSEDMKQVIVKEGAEECRVKVIPAWFDDLGAYNMLWEENRFVKKYKLDKRKVYIQYAGTIGYVFDHQVIIEVAKILRDRDDIEFQMVGEGNAKIDFENAVRSNNLRNVRFYPLQPMELVPDVYSAATIAIIPLKKGVIGNGVPSKAPILMACGKVIITSVETNSQYAMTINNEKIGIAVDIGEYATIADCIVELVNNPRRRNLMGDRARIYSRKQYSSEVSLNRFLETLKEACSDQL